MTKKSKPASLTSSLLARKGEAEPAEPPHTLPEINRPETDETTGNQAVAAPTTELPTAAARPPIESPEPQNAESDDPDRPADDPDRPAPESKAEETTSKQGLFERDSSEEAPASAHGIRASNGQDYAASNLGRLPLPDPVAPAESKDADSQSAIAGTQSEDSTATEPAPVAASAAGEVDQAAAVPPTQDAEAADTQREAVRDARLLRFVYITAALTGIVAILLYAGGWFLDRGAPKEQETAASSAVTATSPEATPAAESVDAKTTPTETPVAAAPKTPPPDTGSSAPAIPQAPPVAPDFTDSGAKSSGSAVTTGGKPKAPAPPTPERPEQPAADAAPKPERETASASGTGATPKADPAADPVVSVPTAPAPAEPSATDSKQQAVAAATPDKPSAAETSGESASVPTLKPPPSVSVTKAPPAPPVASPAKSKAAKTPPAAIKPPPEAKPAKKVPNLRVLAPALVRPEPADKPGSSKSGAKSDAAKTAALAPAESGSTGRFMVQLSSVNSPDRARKEWVRLQKAFPKLFGDRELVLEQRVIPNRGKFFRVQTGRYETVKEARAVCATLKAKNQGCLPIKR